MLVLSVLHGASGLQYFTLELGMLPTLALKKNFLFAFFIKTNKLL